MCSWEWQWEIKDAPPLSRPFVCPVLVKVNCYVRKLFLKGIPVSSDSEIWLDFLEVKVSSEIPWQSFSYLIIIINRNCNIYFLFYSNIFGLKNLKVIFLLLPVIWCIEYVKINTIHRNVLKYLFTWNVWHYNYPGILAVDAELLFSRTGDVYSFKFRKHVSPASQVSTNISTNCKLMRCFFVAFFCWRQTIVKYSATFCWVNYVKTELFQR